MTAITVQPTTEDSCNNWLCCLCPAKEKKRSPESKSETIVERTATVYRHSHHHSRPSECRSPSRRQSESEGEVWV